MQQQPGLHVVVEEELRSTATVRITWPPRPLWRPRTAEEKMHIEYYRMLVHLFEITHFDNMKILKALIYIKDDILPLEVGNVHTRIVDILSKGDIEVLSGKILPHTLRSRELAARRSGSALPGSTGSSRSYAGASNGDLPWSPYHKREREVQGAAPCLHCFIVSRQSSSSSRKSGTLSAKKMMLVALGPTTTNGKLPLPKMHSHMPGFGGNMAYPFTLAKEESLVEH
nr:protein SIEVE ELEMENT OCCLUSION B-like [Ipomoea batatas]